MIWVIQAEYKEDYKVYVKFNDGREGVLDLKDDILNDSRSIFQELRDMNHFKDFVVDMDTIAWSNGADLAPEFLYEKLKEPAKNV